VNESFWTLDRIADALVSRSNRTLPRGAQGISRISTDTRNIQQGDCFVALTGERFDAHDFLGDAVAAGATALVVSRSPQIGTLNVPVFVVDDTLVALGDLARYRRLAWGNPVIAIAGSNGKTSTKELLRAVLSARYTVHATRGNLNNRVGVPLTLLALPDDADVAVIEVGTSLPGEIAMLRDITRPDVAVVTSIAEEHLEGFGSLAGVLLEESAILPGTALAIVPANHPEIAATVTGATRIVTAGLDSGDLRAESWTMADDGTGTVMLDGIAVHCPLRGVHNLRNLMLALAVSNEMGITVPDAAGGLGTLTPPPMRASWERIGSSLVINDAYNANPGSALAAIEMLSAAPGVQHVAILGTMRELGDHAARYHDDVARAALASSADLVAGIGDFSASLGRLAPAGDRVVVAPDVDALWTLLEPRLQPGATILLKASRGVRLERILPHITSWATRTC
jgi:UDP-N-acetylmuramoyl-tripeptide--D-alanyl-D-alanine ligase